MPKPLLDQLANVEFVLSENPKTPFVRIGMCQRCGRPFLEEITGAGRPHKLCSPCRPDQRRDRTRERVRRHRAKLKSEQQR